MPNGDTITIRHLLGMRAGLFNWVEIPGFEERFDANPLLPWTPEDAIKLGRTNPDAPWTAGAKTSTLTDLKVWAEALAAGTLLDPATQADRLETLPLSDDSGPFT